MKKILLIGGLIVSLLGGVVVAEEVLTQADFIKTAIQNNPNYQISAKDYFIALAKNESVQSLEDWNLIASGIFQESNPAPVSAFAATYQKTAGYSLGISRYFAKTGTALQVTHNNTRINADYPASTAAFSPTSPYYISNVSFSISQPLLRNTFGLATKNALAMSEYATQLAQIKLGEDWEEFITALHADYLNWQKSQVALKIYQDKVSAVENQRTLVAKQLKYGLSEEIDLVQIDQKVQAYKIMLEQAKIANESQTKKILLTIGREPKENVLPEDFVQNGKVLEQAVATKYLKESSNIKQTTNLLVAIQQKNLATKENAQLMDVNLAANYTPNAYTHSFNESLKEIGNYNEYSVTVNASTSLQNNKPEAETREAKQAYEKALKTQEATLLGAQIGLESLYINLDHLNTLLELNEKNLKLAEKRYTLEQQKFKQGRSSVFFLMQAEDDALQAENTYNEIAFSRENVLNQINSLTDRYLVQYEGELKL